MFSTLKAAFIFGIVVLGLCYVLTFLSGCSSAMLAKDCKQVQNDNEWFKCTKPGLLE